MSIPYTYLIGWSKYNKFYYGVQYGKNANPRNLWSTYFTSSKFVKDFRTQFGDPDVIQIRQCFESKDEAKIYESKVLKRIKNKQKFLNKIFGYFDKCMLSIDSIHSKSVESRKRNGNYKHSDATKEKIRLTSTGRKYGPMSEKQKQQLSTIRIQSGLSKGKNNPMFGKLHSNESKNKMRKPKSNTDNMGKHIRTDAIKDKFKKSRVGKGTGENNSMAKPENRQKVRDSKIGRKIAHNPITKERKYVFPDAVPEGFILGKMG